MGQKCREFLPTRHYRLRSVNFYTAVSVSSLFFVVIGVVAEWFTLSYYKILRLGSQNIAQFGKYAKGFEQTYAGSNPACPIFLLVPPRACSGVGVVICGASKPCVSLAVRIKVVRVGVKRGTLNCFFQMS